ncbi:polyprenyl diphosphate synthase [Brachybacterium sp. FME24]|uniref:polyprenyl diphosphate synthase n=1 Tax=Brachybacterium sp. FME24 TaxID=2742605 RepID=UPI001865EC0A|nr:polyprenyl diphosphate synthase [Brachybacterium sp. FME24]
MPPLAAASSATQVQVGAPRPRHLGLIMDGNRRWARAEGLADISEGHRAGAEHLTDLLAWASARGIDHVSVYVLSADNIRKRDSLEMQFLFALIETVIPDRVRAAERWQLHISGDLELLPSSTRDALLTAVQDTKDRPGHLTLAIGYDAHQDILDALRRAVTDLPSGDPSSLTVEMISSRLAGGPVKDIDLIIRTGGDSRTSGFFPWQSKSAELYVSPGPWPAFTERDFDEALAYYAARRMSAQ